MRGPRQGSVSLRGALFSCAGKVKIGMDVAASEFWLESEKVYDLDFKTENNDKSQRKTGEELMEVYKEFVTNYPMVSIEDPFDQDDFPTCALAAPRPPHTLRPSPPPTHRPEGRAARPLGPQAHRRLHLPPRHAHAPVALRPEPLPRSTPR